MTGCGFVSLRGLVFRSHGRKGAHWTGRRELGKQCCFVKHISWHWCMGCIGIGRRSGADCPKLDNMLRLQLSALHYYNHENPPLNDSFVVSKAANVFIQDSTLQSPPPLYIPLPTSTNHLKPHNPPQHQHLMLRHKQSIPNISTAPVAPSPI